MLVYIINISLFRQDQILNHVFSLHRTYIKVV